MKSPNPYLIVLDLLWLTALAIFVFAGMNLAPFHGDEAGHIFTTRDFHTAFIERRPEALLVNPPFNIDSESRVRLLNGSVMRYSVGLAWYLRGLTVTDLNASPGWDWGLDYATNVATNHRPSPQLLTIARTVASSYFVLSIVALFLIGRLIVIKPFAWRPVAYIATLAYTLNPVMLLNGRRALVESPYLAFGLLAIWIALEIIRRRANGEKHMVGWWIGLAVTSALCLASKYSGVIFVASAFGGILVAELWRLWIEGRLRKFHDTPIGRPPPGTENTVGTRNGASAVHKPNDGWRRMSGLTGHLTVTGLMSLVLLLAISPALWNDPLTRARDLGAEMNAQVNLVVDILPDAPTTMEERIRAILTQPFTQPVQFFEQESWAAAVPIQDEIRTYMASPLSGVQAGNIGGIGLMLLVAVGLVSSLRLLWQGWLGTDAILRVPMGGAVLLVGVWLAVTVANLLLNPIPWQRYYLPLIPVYAVLIGMAVNALLVGVRRSSTPPDAEPGPAA